MTEQDLRCLEWQKKHKEAVRAHKRAYYYRHRRIMNLTFSKPSSAGLDLGDLAYNDFLKRWNPFI